MSSIFSPDDLSNLQPKKVNKADESPETLEARQSTITKAIEDITSDKGTHDLLFEHFGEANGFIISLPSNLHVPSKGAAAEDWETQFTHVNFDVDQLRNNDKQIYLLVHREIQPHLFIGQLTTHFGQHQCIIVQFVLDSNSQAVKTNLPSALVNPSPQDFLTDMLSEHGIVTVTSKHLEDFDRTRTWHGGARKIGLQSIVDLDSSPAPARGTEREFAFLTRFQGSDLINLYRKAVTEVISEHELIMAKSSFALGGIYPALTYKTPGYRLFTRDLYPTKGLVMKIAETDAGPAIIRKSIYF